MWCFVYCLFHMHGVSGIILKAPFYKSLCWALSNELKTTFLLWTHFSRCNLSLQTQLSAMYQKNTQTHNKIKPLTPSHIHTITREQSQRCCAKPTLWNIYRNWMTCWVTICSINIRLVHTTPTNISNILYNWLLDKEWKTELHNKAIVYTWIGLCCDDKIIFLCGFGWGWGLKRNKNQNFTETHKMALKCVQ